MTTRARAGRLLGGIVAATALLCFLPGQAFAAETPTPAPAPPLATEAPQSVAPLQESRPSAAQEAPTTRAPVPLPEAAAPGQVSRVPSGAADTGDGSTSGGPDAALLALGALSLTGAAGAAGVAMSRRRTQRS
jgi:hypothetical protein